MSSTVKGNAFEDRVFAAVERELRADLLGLSPKHAVAYQKKGYYSRDRDADIVVDVSVEVWLPGADRWSLLWACECKDYGKAVPVDDVEEFKAKLDQIAGANKKGVMAVTGALQRSALHYARAHGIGVMRLLPRGQVQYLLYHMTPALLEEMERRRPAEFYQALTEPGFVGISRDFYAEAGGYLQEDLRSLLSATLEASGAP